MTQVNMFEAKTDLSKLIKMLETKQEDVIYLARNGTAVAQMTLIPKSPEKKHIFDMNKLNRESDAPPHKDPFDRMLICQADVENMLFITHDSPITSYNKSCILSV